MSMKHTTVKSFALCAILVVFFLGLAVPAQVSGDFVTLLKDYPVVQGNPTDVNNIINGLLGISVGFAALLAVVMLALGGFQYMTSDSVFRMGDAKERMTNAIVGLLIVMVAITLLQFINPDIVSLRLFGE